MEPDPLNDPFGDDESLRRLLQASAPSLPDDGFSRRVLAALPPRRRRRRLSAGWLSAAGTLAGLGFVALNADAPDMSGVSARISAALVPAEALSGDPRLPLALIASTLSLVLALAFTRHYGAPRGGFGGRRI